MGTTSSGRLADRTQTAVRLSRLPSLQREDLLLRVVQLLLRAVQHLLRLRQLDLQRADGPVFGRDGLTNTLLHVGQLRLLSRLGPLVRGRGRVSGSAC